MVNILHYFTKGFFLNARRIHVWNWMFSKDFCILQGNKTFESVKM